MSSFSIVIITYNEEKNIGRCIDSISCLSNDIIIVDAYSTDETAEICSSKGVKVISRQWEGYGSAKNFGAEHAKHDWVFSIDADEVCSSILAEHLLKKELNNEHTVFAVRRVNHIGQRPLRFSHLHPEWKPRLYNKHHYQWDDKPVHELLSPMPKELIQIAAELNHFQADSIIELAKSYTHYATLQSQGRDQAPPIRIKKYLSAIYHFVRSYVFMLGFLEGYLGLQLAITRSKTALIKYA